MWSGNNLTEFTEGDPVRVSEEKELISRFGEEYMLYKERVPIFFPLPKKRFKNKA